MKSNKFRVDPNDFLSIGMKMVKRDKAGPSKKPADRRFRSHFGTSPLVVSVLWNLILESPPTDFKIFLPDYLLIGLLFLKIYKSEAVHSAIVGNDEKTFRKWCWIIVGLIADCHDSVVSLNLRIFPPKVD